MLTRYRPAIDMFSLGVARALVVRFQLSPWIPLYEALHIKGLGQADVVLELLRLTLIPEVELLLGHPITRYAARTVKPLPAYIQETTQWDRRIAFAAPNPRLPATEAFQRYKELRPGVTLATALKRGVTYRDIREAISNKWITVHEH